MTKICPIMAIWLIFHFGHKQAIVAQTSICFLGASIGIKTLFSLIMWCKVSMSLFRLYVFLFVFVLKIWEKNILQKPSRDTEWLFLLCFYILRIEGLCYCADSVVIHRWSLLMTQIFSLQLSLYGKWGNHEMACWVLGLNFSLWLHLHHWPLLFLLECLSCTLHLFL